MNTLHIGKPYKEKIGNKVRLCSEIQISHTKKIFYYEVEQTWEQALCTERSDAFLVSLLQYAMANNYDITWETPVTERLLYQFRTIFVPVISNKFKNRFSNIKLNGPTTSKEISKEEWAVGTGVSGGVDSFYSIIKHLRIPEKSQKLTHLLYVSISNHSNKEEKLREDFEENKKNMLIIAKELNLPLITLYSNESEFFFKDIINWGALRFVGMVYSLQRLFSIYYFSSGYPYVDITFGDGSENFDSLHFDLFTLMTVSIKSLNFVSSGGEATRSEKVRYIEDADVVKKNLFVCNYRSDYNCSSCDKCMRTAMQLYGDGKLQEYSSVFDLGKVECQKNKYIKKMLYRKSIFDQEIIGSIQKKERISFLIKMQSVIIRPIYIFWQKLKESKNIMNVFYYFNLDYKLYGKDMAESIRYSKGIEKKFKGPFIHE